jgi:hypothetical protein
VPLFILGAHTWLRKFIVYVPCGLLLNQMTKNNSTNLLTWPLSRSNQMKHNSKRSSKRIIDMICLSVRN